MSTSVLRGRIHIRHPARARFAERGGQRFVQGQVFSSSMPLADPPGLITGASPFLVVIDCSAVAARQATCTSFQSTAASSSFQVEAHIQDGVQLLCDISTGHIQPLIPVEDCQ